MTPARAALRQQGLVRMVLSALLLTSSAVGCATHSTIEQPSPASQPFVPDVTQSEWDAAIPAKGSSIAEPRLIRGKKAPDAQGLLRLGETARVTVAAVIRVDGRVGLYRIIATTNPHYTERVLEVLRSQRYAAPIQSGTAVSIRGDMSFEATRTQ